MNNSLINKDSYALIFTEINEILTYFDDEVCQFSKRLNHD